MGVPYLRPQPQFKRGFIRWERPPVQRDGAAFEIVVNDGTQGHTAQFAVGDVIHAKAFNGTSQVDNYWQVLSVSDDGAASGRFRYDVKRVNGSAASFPAGTPLVRVATASAGKLFVSLSADGQIGSAPNLTVGQYAATPWSAPTVMARLGNLNGSYGIASDLIGLGVGDYASGNYLTYNLTSGLFDVRCGLAFKVTTVTNTYSVLGTDSTVVCNKATPFTVTLPTAVVNQVFTIKNVGAGVVTVDGAGADTIDGSLTQSLNRYESITVQCIAANTWSVI